MDKSVASQEVHFGMSTVMTHSAFGKHAKESLQEVRRVAVRLEEMLSRFIPESEISKVNRSAGVKSERLSEETYEILSSAIKFSRFSRGIFDITIGPLVDLWKSNQSALKPPEDSHIREVLSLVNYHDLLLDPEKRSAGLRRVGQSLDLGGIGKGFAGNKFLQIFKKYGISSAYTNIGGNVMALGKKPDGSFWRIGIQHPREEKSLIGLVSVEDKAVVTSGDYQRYFLGSTGKRYHHILDPATGYPAESGLVSVTVVADSSTTADVLSTIVFVAGREKGLELLRGFRGTEAILVELDLQIYITTGLEKYFQAREGIRVNVFN